MNSSDYINLDNINWLQRINFAQKPFQKSCYKIGGFLCNGVLLGAVSEEVINECFEQFNKEKKECLARGYLFWQFNQEAYSKVFYTNNFEQNSEPLLKKLLSPLNERTLKFVLTFLNNYYVSQLLTFDCVFFKRCWKVLQNDPNPNVSRIRDDIFYGVRSRKKMSGIKKMLIVLNNQQLDNWLSGDLRNNMLYSLPGRGEIIFPNEHVVIESIGSKIMVDDLQRVWNTMYRILPDERLESLGCSFLEGIQTRKDINSPEIIELIERIEFVVAETIQLRMNISTILQDILNEFSEEQPMRSSGENRKNIPKAISSHDS